MNSIQLSFEIATSLSIIGAALTFLWSQIGQSKKARILAIRQQRVEQMSQLIADFAKILDDGDELVEKVKMTHKESEFYCSADDYACFCYKVERYIRINSKLLFEVWATNAEKKVLEDINNIVKNWRLKYLDFSEDNQHSELKDFELLINNIGINIKKMSTLLKLDVEKIHG